MEDCDGCQYLPTEENSTQQICSKIEDGERKTCASHCQYPFPKEVYNPEVITNNHYGLIGVNLTLLGSDSGALEEFLENASSPESIKNEFRQYTSENVPRVQLKCGQVHSPGPGVTMEFPLPPSSDVLEQVILYNIDLNDKGINWSAVRRTEAFETYIDELGEDSGSFINVDGTEATIVLEDGTTRIIEIAENGIDIDWWNRDPLSEDELLSPLPTYISERENILDQIHGLTGGILQNIFTDHTKEKMVIEEVIDWLIKNEIERQNTEVSEKFTMAKFFGISTDQVTNPDFEICMNQLLMTEHDDEVHLKNINDLKNLTELGDPKNRKDLLYVEAKIIKFLIIDPKDIRDCLDIVYITDEICEIGLTSNPTQMMGKFLKLNTDNVDDEKYDDNMRIISKRLLKYLPDMIEKVIELAEYYEKQKCNREIHKNTKLLKEIYSSLFKKNTMVFDFPSLGISEFFRDFQENIITKVILLIFIAYMVTQFIKLFRVNVNLSGGKSK